MSKNALSTLTSLPTSAISVADLKKEYSGAGFIKRLQLVTKGKLVDTGKVRPGHYAIPISEEEATDLGESVDVLVCAVRHKALDTNVRPPVASYNQESELYQDIRKRAGEKNSGCMYGPSFLVYERSTGQFLEIFFGNASGRQESGNLAAYLPVSEAQAKQAGPKFKAQGPQAATLTAKYIKRPKYAWHAPVVGKCSTPFDNLPEADEFVAQITKFLNPKEDGPEVDDGSTDDR